MKSKMLLFIAGALVVFFFCLGLTQLITVQIYYLHHLTFSEYTAYMKHWSEGIWKTFSALVIGTGIGYGYASSQIKEKKSKTEDKK